MSCPDPIFQSPFQNPFQTHWNFSRASSSSSFRFEISSSVGSMLYFCKVYGKLGQSAVQNSQLVSPPNADLLLLNKFFLPLEVLQVVGVVEGEGKGLNLCMERVQELVRGPDRTKQKMPFMMCPSPMNTSSCPARLITAWKRFVGHAAPSLIFSVGMAILP